MPLDSAPPSPSESDLDPIFEEAGQRFDVDPNLLRAQSGVESGGNRYAISPKGAVGLMQVEPETYNQLRQQYPDLSANPFQARSNIMAGAAYLRQMHDQFGPTGAVAAYNAGPERYQDYLNGDASLPDETHAYVSKVSDAYQKRTQQQSAPAPKQLDVRALIDASRKMGASDDEIRAQMQKSPMLSGLWKQSDAAGIPRTDVFAHFGLQPQGKPGQSGLPMAQRDEGTYQTDPKLIGAGRASPGADVHGADADDTGNGAAPSPTANIPGIYEENTSQPAPLPHGYVGDGKPYQGGMDFNLPGGQRTFSPGQVMVPGQTTQGAYRAAAAQGLVGGLGQDIKGASEFAGAVSAGEARPVLAAMDTIDQGKAGPAMFKGMSDAQRAQATAYLRAPPQTRQQMRTDMVAQVAGENQPGPVSAAGQRLIDIGRTNFPIDPSQEGLVTGVVRGAAGTVPMIAGVAAGTAAGGPAGGVIAGAALIGTQSFDAARQDALAKGAASDVADRAATESALANMGIMALPVGRVIQSMPAVGTGVLRAIQTMAKNGVEFGSFNALSQFVTNYVKKTAYDPNQKLMDGTGQSAAEGFVTGMLFGVPHAAAESARAAANLSASDVFARGARGVRAPGTGEGFTAEDEAGGAPPSAALGLPAPSGGPEAPPGAGPRASAPLPAAPALPPGATWARPPATPSAATPPTPAAPTPAETVLTDIAAGKPATGGVQALQAMAQGSSAGAQPATPAPQQPAPQPAPAGQPIAPPAQPAPVQQSPEPEPFEWATAKVGDRMPDGRGVIAGKGMARPDAQALSDQRNGTVWSDGLGPDGKPRYGVVVPEREQVAEGVEVQRPPEDKPGQELPTTAAQIDQAAAQAAEPTPAQAGAGNYRKGKTNIGGLPVTIETPRGEMRRGVGPDGQPWEVQMPGHYGEIAGTKGADGSPLDITLGPLAHQAVQHPVFVVDQINPATGEFDEHKAFAGYPTDEAATAAYDASFSDGSGPSRRGAVNAMSFPDFKEWATNGDTTKALSYREPVQEASTDMIGAGDLWNLPPEHLEAMLREKTEENQQKIVRALGSEEAAAEFNRLDRKQNSSDPTRADEGAREFNAKFGSLTPDQERLIYGIGETDAQIDDIKAVLGAHNNRSDDATDAAYEAAAAIRSAPAAEIMAVPKGGASTTAQGAFVRLKNAYEDMTKSGVPGDRIGNEIAGALVRRGGWKPGDAAEIVGTFLDEMRRLSPKPAQPPAQEQAKIAAPAPKPAQQKPPGAMAPVGDAGFPAVRSGEQLRSKSGRELSPVPKFTTDTNRTANIARSRLNVWLLTEARKEAAATRDTNLGNFLRGMDPKNFSQSDRDMASDVLWGDETGPKPEHRGAAPVASPEPPVSTETPEAAATPPEEPTDGASQEAPGFGANNKTFTADKAAAARARLREKMNRLNSGFDPEAMQDAFMLGGYYIEGGIRKFGDFARKMVEDISDKLQPVLQHVYRSVRDYPGFDNAGMDDDATISAELQRMAEVPTSESQEAKNGVQGGVPANDAGPSAEDVHGVAPVGETGSVRPGEVGAGAPDAERNTEVANAGQEQPPDNAAGAGSGGTGARVDDRIPAAGDKRNTRAPRRPAERPDANVTGENHVIEPGTLEESRGPKAKALDNVAAIQLVKKLEAEQRPATKAEQDILAKYVGWGGLKGAFRASDSTFGKGFEDVGRTLERILGPEEYATAERSTQYAHYTAEHVVRSMWDAVRQMGFEGGRVFEPGMGIGHFLGLMPPDLSAKSSYRGVEMDHMTAGIAKLLYPKAGVQTADFSQMALPEKAFDLVIGNPPFSDTVVSADPKYRARGFMLHDYFFAKSLDAVRPGGLLGFITSAGTMNKMDSKAREYLAQRAEFAGGIRLPAGTFRENARTDVTTDILFFKRRTGGDVAFNKGEEPSWTQVDSRALQNRNGKTVEGNVSRYFSEHPENVLGEEGFFDKSVAAADRYAVRPRPGSDVKADLQQALSRLPRDIMEPEPTPEMKAALDFSSEEKKDGSFYLSQSGQVMQYRGGAGVQVQPRGKGAEGGLTAAELERVRHLIPLRDALREVFSADLARDEGAGAAARARLNHHYDRFVQKFGPINKAEFQYRRPNSIQQESARLEAREEARFVGMPFDDGDFDPSSLIASKSSIRDIAKARTNARDAATRQGRPFNEGTFDPNDMPDVVIENRPNIRPFMGDPESYRLRSIEKYNDSTGEAEKRPIFSRNILKFEPEPEIRSANDGVLWSMNQFGRFDLDKIAEKMGVDRNALISELGDAVFKLPGTRDTYQTSDEYLSGDVVSKMEVARAEAERDPDIMRNISALEAVQPAPLAPSQISMVLGMPWVPIQHVKQFVQDILELGSPTVFHSKITGQWSVDAGRWMSAPGAPKWGTDKRDAFELLSDALNRTPPRIYDTVREPGGGTKSIFNPVATQAAQDKVEAIKAAFTTWTRADDERADGLAKIYNAALNRTVLRQYDGGYLTTPGVSSDWSWRPHQKRVISRVIQNGTTYMAHAVGSGKTSNMIGAGMEMRRLGLVKKPLYTVPNHMLGQFTKEFYEQYPTARIAVADDQRFITHNRRQFVANVAQDDLDAVIITHSGFGMIPISEEFQGEMIREQLDELNAAIAEAKAAGAERFTVGRLQNQREKLEQKLRGQSGGKKDQTLTFEQMGVDFLFVDEAHQFRKLQFATKQQGLKGIDPSGSNMAFDLYTKVRYLDQQNPGRAAVFASGTPVTNTMGELYSLSRFMQRQALADKGLSSFDAWAQTFGDTKTGLEETAAGTYQPVTRFGQFLNLPELYKMVGEVMDIVTPAQLEQYVTRPKIQGESREFHLAPRTAILDAYQEELGQRMEAIKARGGRAVKGQDILLSVIGDGRHAAIDPRFVMETGNDPNSKLNVMIRNVARIHNETADQTFYDPRDNYQTPVMRGPAAQMIFSNLGVNGRGPMGFSSYAWIKEALRREGIPPAQVAFIGDYKTAIQRQALFNDINEGKVRILVGSTQKMGTGVNAQRRLVALHNLDPLWYPSDDEQRVGRILRQGNMNPEIQIHDYSTKGTYDSAMWKMMGNKARFIEQFFRGDPDLRNMEDLGEASMYEQASAMSTTDERIIALTELRQNLDRARRREDAHNQEQFSLRRRLENRQWWQENSETTMANIAKSIARRQDTSGDNFSAAVGGRTYAKRAEAGDALDAVVKERAPGLGKNESTTVGSIGGFPIILDSYHGLMLRTDSGDYSIRGEGGRGKIASAESILRGFEDDLERAKQNRERYIAEGENIKPLIGKKFEGWQEIADLASRADEMERQIKENPVGASAPPGGPPEDDDDDDPSPPGNRMAGVDLSDAGEIRAPPASGRDVDLGVAPSGLAEDRRTIDEMNQAQGTGEQPPAQPARDNQGVESPKPGSTTRTARWPAGGGQGFRDLTNEAPESGHEAAGNWVTERGRATGHEHIAVVDDRTGDIIHAGTNGDGDTVDFLHDNVANNQTPVTLHHNHPSSRSTSAQDTAFLANPGVSHVVAHGHDGEMSAISLGPRLFRESDLTPDNIGQNATKIRAVYGAAAEQAETILNRLVNSKKITNETAMVFYNDVANRLLQARHVINYASTRQLPKPIADALQSHLRSIGYEPGVINRSTQSVQHEGGYASLPRPSQGLSQSGHEADIGRGSAHVSEEIEGGAVGGVGQNDRSTIAVRPEEGNEGLPQGQRGGPGYADKAGGSEGSAISKGENGEGGNPKGPGQPLKSAQVAGRAPLKMSRWGPGGEYFSVPVEFRKVPIVDPGAPSPAVTFGISPDGQAYYAGSIYPDKTQIVRAIDAYLAPFGEDTYVRSVLRPEDYKHLSKGTHRGSKNHATGESEDGLSVAHVAEIPSNYAYLVKGRRIGSGSDFEPLLDTATASPASPLMKWEKFSTLQKKAIDARIKQLGLSRDEYRALVSGHKKIVLPSANIVQAREGLAEDRDRLGEGQRLYSFPAMLFDPATWRRAFNGVSAVDLRKTMRLGESSRDGMSLARKTADEIHVLFSPTSRGTDAKGMEHIIRAKASMLARASDQSAFALERFSKAVDRLPEDQQLAITDRVERGLPQPSPELQTTMTALKAEQDKWLRQIQSIGRLQDIENSDDYMGRIYSNYPEWKAGQQPPDPQTGERRAVGAVMGKSPIRGRAGFLKDRTFETLADAMQAGLIPVTTNPIKMQMLKLREMQRFYYGTRMADDIKASGIARWVPASREFQAKAEGLVKLDDPFFQPKLRPDQFGDGTNGVPMNMRIDPGAWYAPRPAANVFNNYVSRGISGHSVIYDAIRRSGNALNSAQLSLSGFHATFVTLDSIMSHMALGMQQAVRAATGRDLGTESRLGTLGKGLATMATSPAAPVMTFKAGNALRRAWLDPVNATPEMRRLADMLNAGGGRISMDQFYRSNASGAFFKSLTDIKNFRGVFGEVWQAVKDTPLRSPFLIAGRMIDTINEPLMGQLVPRMKQGVFAAMARDYLDRFPDATPEEASDAMTKAWDSVENRMGQMTYDNVFWNKTAKDMAFLMTRSVGWNLGTIREIGGGAGPDSARFIRDIASGKRPDFTARMAYPIAMTVVTALVGATLTYLLTGKAPQQMLDYFYPPTGSVDDGGEPNRLSIPGYIKDVIAYKKDPAGTILNKIQPLAEMGKEIYTNRDYYGGSIYDPKFDSSATSAYGDYLMNEALPFSIRATIKNRNEGESMETQMLSFWGIQPAPQSIVHQEKEEKWQAGQDKRAFRQRLKEEGKGRLAPFSGQ